MALAAPAVVFGRVSAGASCSHTISRIAVERPMDFLFAIFWTLSATLSGSLSIIILIKVDLRCIALYISLTYM